MPMVEGILGEGKKPVNMKQAVPQGNRMDDGHGTYHRDRYRYRYRNRNVLTIEADSDTDSDSDTDTDSDWNNSVALDLLWVARPGL